MNYETFSSSQVYKTLPFITDRLNELPEKDKHRFSKFLHSFNIAYLQLKKMEADNYFEASIFCTGCVPYNLHYFSRFVLDDYMKRLDAPIFQKYDPTLISYIRNFLHTKIKLLEKIT